MKNEYLNNKTFESIIQLFQFYSRQRTRMEFVLKDAQQAHERRVKKYDDQIRKENVNSANEDYGDACVHYLNYQSQLARAFYLLSENIAKYAKFQGIDTDDAIQEGVLICFEKIDRFDPRKGKAFNYMTTCILNHYRQLYRSARNYNELKKRYHTYLQDSFDSIIVRNGKERSSQRNFIDSETNIW